MFTTSIESRSTYLSVFHLPNPSIRRQLGESYKSTEKGGRDDSAGRRETVRQGDIESYKLVNNHTGDSRTQIYLCPVPQTVRSHQNLLSCKPVLLFSLTRVQTPVSGFLPPELSLGRKKMAREGTGKSIVKGGDFYV